MTIPIAPPDPALSEWPVSGHVVVFDLEFTAWEGSLARRWSEPWEHREVIQFGAVRLDAASFMTEGTFEALVRPKLNPALSDYIGRLTGLTDQILAERGEAYPDALARFVEFVGPAPLLANGWDGAVIRENCGIHALADPFPGDRIRDLRPALARVLGVADSELVSCQLPALLGIGEPPTTHSAILDAHAIARALRELRLRREI